MNAYEVLDLPESATTHEIRKRRNNLLLKTGAHPDLAGTNDAEATANSEQLTKEINKAAAILLDPVRRADHDAALRLVRSGQRTSAGSGPSNQGNPARDNASSEQSAPRPGQSGGSTAYEPGVTGRRSSVPIGRTAAARQAAALRREQRRAEERAAKAAKVPESIGPDHPRSAHKRPAREGSGPAAHAAYLVHLALTDPVGEWRAVGVVGVPLLLAVWLDGLALFWAIVFLAVLAGAQAGLARRPCHTPLLETWTITRRAVAAIAGVAGTLLGGTARDARG